MIKLNGLTPSIQAFGSIGKLPASRFGLTDVPMPVRWPTAVRVH